MKGQLHGFPHFFVVLFFSIHFPLNLTVACGLYVIYVKKTIHKYKQMYIYTGTKYIIKNR